MVVSETGLALASIYTQTMNGTKDEQWQDASISYDVAKWIQEMKVDWVREACVSG